jgi:hypothetical protein
MIQLKAYAHDTGTPAYWRSYAKALGRRWGYMQAAKHYASCKGSAVIHHADDSATVIVRDEGMSYLRIVARKHGPSAVRWLAA